MGNHPHFLPVAEDAETVVQFIRYVKKETTEAIKRLTGNSKLTLWEEGYDSPQLLTPTTVIKYISYIYTNPADSNLVDSIDDYPGLSSWEMYMGGKNSRKCSWIRRYMIKPLVKGSVSRDEDKKLVEKLKKESKVEHEFKLYPNEWMKCFKEYRDRDPEEIKEEILSFIRAKEDKCRKKRDEKGWTVLGAAKLRTQSIYKKFKPKKWGRRMLCLSDDIELRQEFLIIYKQVCEKCHQVYRRWRAGDFRVPFPEGMFAPRIPPTASVIDVFS